MANKRHHSRTAPSPSWAAKGVKRLRRIEGMIERHWVFGAYILATIATVGYVVGQLAPIL